MKKNVSKWLSALLALCLLCAALPLGGVMAATTKTEMTAADNRISNGDFECFRNGEAIYWHGGVFGENETYGRYARIYDITSDETRSMYQTIAVDSGTTYKLTFKAKVVSGSSFTVNVEDNNSVRSLQRACTGTADWNTYVYLFKYDGSLQEAKLRFTVEATDVDVYIDDVTLDCETDNVTETTGVSYDGYIIDGDFESGSTNYWTVTGGEIVTFDGDYALKSTTTSRYSTVAEQVILVEENTDYTLNVKSYYDGSLTGGIARVHIYAGTSGTTELASPSYYWNITAGSWNNHQLTFNSGANAAVRIVLQQHAAPSSSTAMDGNIYYDDIVMMKASDVPHEFIANGDFESSDLSAWKVGKGVISSNLAHGGSQSLYSADNTSSGYGYTANYYPTVVPNSQYTVTFWYSYVSSSAKTIRLYVHDGADNGTTNIKAANNGAQPVFYCNDASAVAGVWKQATLTFNSGNNTKLLLKFGGGSSGYNAVYLDDVVMTGPVPDSGDSGETPVEPEEPTLPDVNTGYYFYSNQAYQTIQEVDLAQWVDIDAQAGKTYKITFSARAITNGFRLYINDETNNDLFWGEDIRSWQTIEIYHRISASEMKIKLRTLGNAGVETNLYIDLANITVEEIPDTEVNLITHNGKSAMEMDDTGLVGGLAFKYSVNMLNAQTTEPDGIVRRYIEGTASAYPYTNEMFPDDPYEYTVLRVGSIMTFDATQVNNMTVENANPNSSVINIVGEKRMAGETSADTYTFAVRIINIPERHFDTVIYSRPYITVQAGDRIVTLYGETQSESYNGIMLS